MMNEVSTPQLVDLVLYLKTRFLDPNTTAVLDEVIAELARRATQ